MGEPDVSGDWERAAPGWARWEPAIAAWMEPATRAMLTIAAVDKDSRVLDLASGAGSQALRAAHRVGPGGEVVANDISRTMLDHVARRAREAGLDNVSTLEGPAEELDLPASSFDAVICRLGLMLFTDPAAALVAARRALRPGGRLAVVVFGTPAANPFMSEPMRILLRHAGKDAPPPGRPGVFALGAAGALRTLLSEAGFASLEQRTVRVTLRMDSGDDALAMMQEAFAAYRAVIADRPDGVQAAAWQEVADALGRFGAAGGFEAPGEVLVAGGVRPG